MGSGGVKCSMQSSTPLNFLGPLLCLLQQHLQPSIYFCFSLGQYMIFSQGYFVYCGIQKNTKLHIMTYRSVSLLSKGPMLNQAVAHSRGCRAGCCKRVDPHTHSWLYLPAKQVHAWGCILVFFFFFFLNEKIH